MTETMIDRVARALHEAHKPWCDYTHPFEDPRSGREVYEALARAAIAALREPTEVMMDEGVDCRQHDGGVTHVPAP